VAFGAQPLSFLQRAEKLEHPLPLHLLDLQHEGGTGGCITEWNLCDTQVHSNLGGQGPDGGAEELRFSDVGQTKAGQAFDLKVVNTSAYLAHDNLRNTARGCFGVINVKKDSNVSLSFSFVISGTDTPIDMESNLYFSFFDLDCSASGCESVIVDFTKGKNFFVDDDTELAMNNIFTPLGKELLRLDATNMGSGSDNPPPLEALQRSRAVSLELGDSTLEAVFTVKESSIGRNFLIGGKTTMVPDKENTESPTPTPTKMGTEQSCSDCLVWGDPHIITFDLHKKRLAQHPMREAFFRTRGWKNDQISIYNEGTFWLVKTDLVHIQARYWHNKTHPDWTSLGALAIGGPLLDYNTLIIRSLSGATTWNGQEILHLIPSQFENSLISAKYTYATELVKDGTRGPGLEIELPKGIKLVVNRWMQSLAAKITMCGAAETQTGQCGNFNGNPNDDDQDVLSESTSQRVLSHQILF
jgi:hypothetical protein